VKPQQTSDTALRSNWRRNLRWIYALLAIWFVVTFIVSWFARELDFDFFGWPFSFWVGAQGAPVVYVLMIALYAWRMNRADEDADTGTADITLPSQGTTRGTDRDAA